MLSSSHSKYQISSLAEAGVQAGNGSVTTWLVAGGGRRLISTLCQVCGTEFEAEVWFKGSHAKSCPACNRREEEVRECQQRESQRVAEQERRRKTFHAAVSPLYRVSDPASLPTAGVEAVDAYGAADYQAGIGLGLIGPAGAGKTRCMGRLISRLCMEDGAQIVAVTATEFSHRVSTLASDNLKELERYLKQLVQVSILFVDDVGKGRMTDRVEAEFYHLLEQRTAHGRPTLWTSNASAAVLLRIFSPDRGKPIVRRLAEFSRLVHLSKEGDMDT